MADPNNNRWLSGMSSTGEVYSSPLEPDGEYAKIRQRRIDQQKAAQEKHRQWLKERGLKCD